MKEFSDPHGTSDLRAAYRDWWLMETAMKLRAVYHERYAMGVIRGTVPKGTPKPRKQKLLALLKRIQKTWR